MYTVTKSIDVDFAHHISGHPGACINIHGHTWKFEVTLQARYLDDMGFVCDFKELKALVLQPVHTLLDHSLALGEKTYQKLAANLTRVGATLVATRGQQDLQTGYTFHQGTLNGARNAIPGGIKVALFPFTPTSERLAEWLYGVAEKYCQEHPGRVHVTEARVYEALHPVVSVAAYTPG